MPRLAHQIKLLVRIKAKINAVETELDYLAASGCSVNEPRADYRINNSNDYYVDYTEK